MEELLRCCKANNVAAYNKIANTYLTNPSHSKLRKLAIAFYKKSLAIEPDNIKTLLGLATAYHLLGKYSEARDCCNKALAIEPDSIQVLLFGCVLQIPVLYILPGEILSSRQHYHRSLLQLVDSVDFCNAKRVAKAANAIGEIQPYYLPFQGHDDTELQRIYGSFVSRVLSVQYPQWKQTLKVLPPTKLEPIRVGIVSTNFHSHSVWKVIIKGWVSQLDRERFSLLGYSLGSTKDKETEYAKTCFVSFVEGPLSFEDWCQKISKDHPHVLIYPEIGMNQLALKLAGLRLAPVQCASWGHSVTTGLPTIDYFLSSECIEPPGAEDHYTEKLVKLPNLSIYYTPTHVELTADTDEEFGIRHSAIVYFCAQSLFKYLPQYDLVWPYIARQVGDCQFVFLADKKSEGITKQFEQRLECAFAAVNLHKENHMIMLPNLSQEAYQSINHRADIYLDSIGWSGGTTTLEAISYNLPVVTLPGIFFRGRMSYGILTRMGVTETIANNIEEYIEIAGRLGKDSLWRKQITVKMSHNKHKVYWDMESINGLELFLENAVRL